MVTVEEISRTYDSDPGHNEQVTALALEFFDSLSSLHGYGKNERRLLEIASRMHDIGWSQTVVRQHQKLSRDMILESDIPGLDEDDKLICALVAQYHTKSLPDALKHSRFAALSQNKRNLVEWLSAILRVADALDSSHLGLVRKLRVEIDRKALIVHITPNGECRNEIRRAHRKEDLLVKKSERSVVYLCS